MFNLSRSKTEAKVEGAAPPLFSAAATKETRRDAAWLASRLARSKQFRPGEMETETVDVSPALAELMLEHNTRNRPIAPRRIERHVTTIKDGRWRLVSQGISFDRAGALADGQHRLRAIIEAGISVPCRVTFGEAPENFDVLDTGAPRGGADTLAIAGYKYWTNLAAGARVYSIVSGPTPASGTSLSNDQTLEMVRQHPLMAEVCADAVRIALKIKVPSAPLVAALFIIRQAIGRSEKYAAFIERLAEGTNLSKRDPILVLRDMFATRAFDTTQNTGGKNSRICASVILCWNRWSNGRTASVGALRWNPVTAFPVVE